MLGRDGGHGEVTATRVHQAVTATLVTVALGVTGCTPSTAPSGSSATASPTPTASVSHSPTPGTRAPSPTPSSQEDGAVQSGTTATGPSTERPASPSTGSTPTASGATGPSGEDVDCRVTACVALTFDDGPDARTTGRLLDILRDLHVHATFFPVGTHVAEEPELVGREAAEGHVVGSHTWDHRDLTGLSAAAQLQELESTADAVRAATGSDPVLVRPPYGAWNATVRTQVTRTHAAIVLWNIDSQDWKSRNTRAVVDRVLATTTRGSVILMHDIYPTTVDAVPEVVAGLRKRGLTPVTVPTLLGGSTTEGWVYYSQHDLIRPGSTVQTTH